MALNSNFATSKVAPQERWLKLYRKIHNLFLKDEFIHTVDYNQMVTEMNARITELETKLVTELAARDAAYATHFHLAPQAPTGQLPTLPPTVPYVHSLTPTKPVVPVVTAMTQTDAAYQAMGPAFAPIGDGLGVEATLATTTSQSEVGA